MKTISALTLCVVVGAANAGPASNNIAYKCTINGKTSYSDAPCADAKVVDTTPTDGLNSMSGKKVWTPEAQRKHFEKGFDEAIKPMTGKSHEEMNVMRRRLKHEPAAKKRCYELDDEIPALERGTDKDRLLNARTEYYRLKC